MIARCRITKSYKIQETLINNKISIYKHESSYRSIQIGSLLQDVLSIVQWSKRYVHSATENALARGDKFRERGMLDVRKSCLLTGDVEK